MSCEIPFCQFVCKLVFGVDILDLNFGVQINSVKRPIKSNSVGSGYMSHCWTLAFDDHFNHGVVILKDVQRRTFYVVELVWRRMKRFFNQIPKIKSWNSIHA